MNLIDDLLKKLILNDGTRKIELLKTVKLFFLHHINDYTKWYFSLFKLSDTLKKQPNSSQLKNHQNLFMYMINELHKTSLKDDSKKLIIK
jgi:hypothetical protein